MIEKLSFKGKLHTLHLLQKKSWVRKMVYVVRITLDTKVPICGTLIPENSFKNSQVIANSQQC